MQNAATVKVLGARGTVPIEGEAVARYGGATACVLVRLGGENIVLDAGTGLLDLDRVLLAEERAASILLGHPHFDHLLGLPFCPVLYDSTRRVDVYAAERGGLGPRQQLERLMSPPLWPVGPEVFTAEVGFHTIEGDFALGGVSVRVMEGCHPGGCSVFRLDWGGTSVVYASDYELDGESFPRLASFAEGCTLLLCDGQYFETERAEKRGFGHSTWREAARLASVCNAHILRILHHDPWHSDRQLDAAAPELERLFQNGAFARSGEEISL